MITVNAHPTQVAKLAYKKYTDRGYLHGYDQRDWEDSVRELQRSYLNKFDMAVCETLRKTFFTWTYMEVFDWNFTALKMLLNDYFPLLKFDDMPEYGQRLSAKEMFEMILQRDRILYPESHFTEEEFDRWLDYKKMLQDVINYITENEIPKKQLPLPCEEKYQILKSPDKPFGKLKNGVRLRVLRNQFNARSPLDFNEPLKPGEEIVVSNFSKIKGYHANLLYWVYFYVAGCPRQYIAYCDTVPLDYFPLDLPFFSSPIEKTCETNYLPVGNNVHQDAIIREKDYLGYRLNPRHLADIISLRASEFVTAQQAKILLSRCWEDWCCHDVFYHLKKERFLEELSGELEELLRPVLLQQSQAVNDYKNGKSAAFGRLMGAAMRIVQGKSSPAVVRSTIEKLIA